MTALTAKALQLPPAERLKLIEEVWESLAAQPGSIPVDPQDVQELERRKRRYDADPNSLIDWQELKSRLHRPGTDAR